MSFRLCNGPQRFTHSNGNTSAHVCDALADSLGHVRPQEHGAEELEDAPEHHGLPQGQGLGSDGRGEGVSDIVGSDPESSEESTESGDDEDPEPLIRRLRRQYALVEDTNNVGHLLQLLPST